MFVLPPQLEHIICSPRSTCEIFNNDLLRNTKGWVTGARKRTGGTNGKNPAITKKISKSKQNEMNQTVYEKEKQVEVENPK